MPKPERWLISLSNKVTHKVDWSWGAELFSSYGTGDEYEHAFFFPDVFFACTFLQSTDNNLDQFYKNAFIQMSDLGMFYNKC